MGCKCIKKSYWYLIDDSFNNKGISEGGKFSFHLNEEYSFTKEDTAFGEAFYITHPDKKDPVGFDKKKFFEHFKIIE